jgi:uncharacterized protein (TIGR00299 family) protein
VSGELGVHDECVAWFHCFSGIAGDMALGSLLDAGADQREVLKLLERVPLPGWELRFEETLRGGIACTRAIVSGKNDVVVRTHAHIAALIEEARLPDRVTQRALRIFSTLAEVEARLHRRSTEQVHFHEVGGHDAVVDIVGTVCAMEVLGIDVVTASKVATGSGTVRTAHGLLPNPSPAVVRLLSGVPTYGRDTTIELTTPTGAAILAALASSYGPLPAMEISSSGFGAGSHELDDLPNCTQVVVGTRGASVASPSGGQPIVVLEANLDDATGEQLAHALSSLLEAGANDAWVTPVLMKKGRPGHTISVLCDPVLVGPLKEVLASTTGTLGVRALSAERWPLPRSIREVLVQGEPVRVKVTPGRAKPEFEDVARVASLTGLPTHEVSSRAEEAWRQSKDVIEQRPGDDEPA